MNRKDFLSLSGLGLAGLAMPRVLGAEDAPAAPASAAPVLTGNGEFVFEAVHAWGEALPSGEKIGPTHGGIARDKAGNIYVNTDGPSGTLVYAPDGKFLAPSPRSFPASTPSRLSRRRAPRSSTPPGSSATRC